MILRDRSHSDIFDKSKVILKPCGFSDILFAYKLPKAITLVARQISLRSNITRRKANKTGVVSFRTLRLTAGGFFVCIDRKMCFCYTELGTGLRLGRTPRGESTEKTSFSLFIDSTT